MNSNIQCKTETNARVIAQLALERCQNNLAHLHALMYLCEPYDLGLDETLALSARNIMAAIDQELALSSKALKS